VHGGSRRGSWRMLAVGLMMIVAGGCGPRIDAPEPIPEHRIEPCEQWCAMIFDPACPQDVVVETEEECVESCATSDVTWAPVEGDHDACAETQIPFVDCMAMLSCEEREPNFTMYNDVPTEDLGCGILLRAQLDCQTEHY